MLRDLSATLAASMFLADSRQEVASCTRSTELVEAMAASLKRSSCRSSCSRGVEGRMGKGQGSGICWRCT